MYKVKINFISEIEIMSIIDRLDKSGQKSHIIVDSRTNFPELYP